MIDKRDTESVDPDNTQDFLIVNGTDEADNFLLRPGAVFALNPDVGAGTP